MCPKLKIGNDISGEIMYGGETAESALCATDFITLFQRGAHTEGN